MTTKQIAESLGKPVRTVQDWVKSLSAKSALISAKSESSSPAYPADYDLNETCQIIEEGMGPDVANTFRTNAVYGAIEKERKLVKPKYSAAMIREARIIYGIEYAKRLMAENEGLPYQAKHEPVALPAPEQLPEHIAKQVYAVALSAMKKAMAQEATEKKNGKLF